MSCCGQRRRALASPAPHVPSGSPVMRSHAPGTGPGAAAGGIALRYLGLGPFTSRSPRTGRLYACGGSGATLRVDAADVDAMLRTRLFRRER